MIKIALLGFGTVGRGTYEILTKKSENIKKVIGEEVFVSKILKRNLNFQSEIDKSIFTDNFKEIVEDEEIKLVVEMTGDLKGSYGYIKEALNAGKHVVTANKAVVSEYFEEFLELAEKNKVAFLYEAAVAGSIPIITPLKTQVLINDITRVRGILNGTSNFLLTNMQVRKSEYKTILKEAQELGYAEADPYDDVEGMDALRKLRILSTIAFKTKIRNEDILRRGISSIDLSDIAYLNKKNYKVKLIAEAIINEGKFKAVVEPVILSSDDELYGIDGSVNSVEIFGENYGSLVFVGEGAGSLPTGNAIVSDILDALSGHCYPILIENNLINDNENYAARYYVRIKNGLDLSADWIDFIESHGDHVIIETKEVKREFLLEQLKTLNIKEEDCFYARLN